MDQTTDTSQHVVDESRKECDCKCPCHHEDKEDEKLPRLSLKDIAPRLPDYMVDEYMQERFLAKHSSDKCGPRVVEFSPWSAYPSSLVVIIGYGFVPRRASNKVTIGGRQALVVTAERHRLVVISDFKTRNGPVHVKNENGESKGPRDFKVLSWPAPYPASESDGPPHSFRGIGDGSWTDFKGKLSNIGGRLQDIPTPGLLPLAVPRTGTARVLAVCCYPSDRAPADLAAAKATIVNNCASMTRYFDQASYGKLNVAVDVTDYFELLDNFDWYYRASPSEDGYPNFKAEVLPQLYAESANLAETNGFDLDNYDILMTVVRMGSFVRAWGGGSIGPSIKYFRAAEGTNPAVSIDVSVTGTLGTITLGDDADWGRYAHEFGHNIVPPPGVLQEDIYASGAAGTDFTAAPFDLMGYHDSHPLFSGYNIDGLGWFDASNVLRLTWSRSPFSQEVDIVAHGLTQNTDTNRVHLVRIEVSSGLAYYIEVRQDPGTTAQEFDTNISNPPGKDGGVLVTRAITGTLNNNQNIRLITLLQASQSTLSTGQVAVDPARTILITVVNDNVQASPLVCKVRIEWAQPATGTPGGTFDLSLEPWGPSYSTRDIWIDRNPFGSYDSPIQDASGNPIDGGDVPRLGELNKIHARIRNSGTSDATNVLTTFYVNTPPGIGDSGNWTPLRTLTVPTVSAGSTHVAEVDWAPRVGEHTCLKVAVVPQTGEVSVSNNQAQENVFTFQPASRSVPEPVELPVTVRNPLDKRTLIWIAVDGVPEGYYVYFPRQWLYLEGRAERNLELLVIPLRGIREQKFNVANVRVTGHLPWWYTEKMPINGLPPASVARHIGGIQASVAPKRGSSITLQPEPKATGKEVTVFGNVSPATADQAVRVDMTWQDELVLSRSVKTNGRGRFEVTFYIPGRRSVFVPPSVVNAREVILDFQAHIINATVLAPSDSNIVHYVARVGSEEPEEPEPPK